MTQEKIDTLFNKSKMTIYDKLQKYEAKYVKSEDGVIGLELSEIVDIELQKLQNRIIKLLK